ncbi:MAG: hypothetical protein ACP6IT_02840 [Candidatus Thorarchaeota archaeon]
MERRSRVFVELTGVNTDDPLEMLKNVARSARVSLPERDDESEHIFLERVRGRLNKWFLDNTEPWMRPQWMLRANIPKTGDLLCNSTRCGWSVIGEAGGRAYGIADHAGLLTTGQCCGSLDFWLLEDNNIVFPALLSGDETQLALESADDQVYVWSKSVGPVEFTRFVYHHSVHGHEMLFNEIFVNNKSLEDASITFFAALRPISVFGIDPVFEMRYDDARRQLYANGHMALECNHEPDLLVMTTANNPHALSMVTGSENRLDHQFRTASGLCTAILRYSVKLRPARSKTFFFVQPLGIVNANHGVYQASPEARFASVERWFEFMDETANGRFPDPFLDRVGTMAKAVVAAQAQDAIMGDKLCLTPTEKGRLVRALLEIGGWNIVLRIAENVSRALRDGPVNNTSSILPVLWGLLEMQTFGTKNDVMPHLRPVVEEAWYLLRDRLTAETTTDPQPDMEPAMAPDPGSPTPSDNDSFESVASPQSEEGPVRGDEHHNVDIMSVVDFLWLLATTKTTIQALERLGEKNGALELRDLLERYEQRVGVQTREAMSRLGGLQCDGVGNLVRMIDTGTLLGPDLVPPHVLSECVQMTKRTLAKRGIPKSPDRSGVNLIYMVLRLAHAQAMMNDGDSVEYALETIRKYVCTNGMIPDEIADTNRTPIQAASAIRSATDFILMLRAALIREENENLVITPAVPDEWFVAKRDLLLSRAPTRFGPVSVEMGLSANQHQIEIKMSRLPAELEIHVPSFRGLKTFKVYGGSVVERVKDGVSPKLRVVPLSDNVVVTYHR